MSIAQRITERMQAENRSRSGQSIYAIAMDEHNVHCLTEAHLDVWWESLAPEEKAEIYEAHLDGRIGEDETLAWAESRLRGGNGVVDSLRDLGLANAIFASDVMGGSESREPALVPCSHPNQVYTVGNTYCRDCRAWLNGGMPRQSESREVAGV